MAKKKYGRTTSGVPIADELVEEPAGKAEAGYDVEEMLRRRGGRPSVLVTGCHWLPGNRLALIGMPTLVSIDGMRGGAW